jgi:hypothetical protein
MGTAEPGILHPDAIECLVSVGDLDAVERLLEEHEEKARRPTSWLSRPLGDVGDCSAPRAVTSPRGSRPRGSAEEHERLSQPFELGRTLLVRGEVPAGLRGRPCPESMDTLDRSSAAPVRGCGGEARAELARSEGLPRSRAHAHGTADRGPGRRGRTNRDRDALFISVKTVEANLARIFHKRRFDPAQLIRSMMSASSGLSPEDHDPKA